MISIDIDLPPKAQARPRMGKWGAYDPSKKEKDFVKWQMKSQYRNSPITGPVKLSIVFFMPVPDGNSNLKKRQMINGIIAHDKKPDIDNLVKFMLDCLNKIVIEDDSLVIEMRVKKIYAERPGTSIQIMPLANAKGDLLYENIAREF